MTFQELGLQDSLMRAINDLGYTNPTPIQEQTIQLLTNKSTDVVALAQTGTGKTAAFGLPILNKLDANNKDTQALILAPTRELCMQITNDLKNFGKYVNGLNIVAVYGGASIENQIRDIKKGTQIVVATPGRLVDLIERRAVRLQTISTVVLDEADEMLNMGFKDDLDMILGQAQDTKNTWLFSATMPREVERIAKNYMNNPVELSAGKKNEGATNITHLYYSVSQRDRYAALKRIADFYPEIFGLVFCRTKAETQQVADSLIKDGYNADALHGDLSQSQRDFVMKRFRSRTLQMLVATDVAARGIDVDSITHVINYNLPEDVENYTHRSGRTARAGRSGISIVIATPKEMGRIKDIERILNKKFDKASIPTGTEVCEKQLFHLVHKLHDVEVKDDDIEQYLPKIYEELKDLSKEELIKRFISEEFNRFYAYYQNAPDLNQGSEGQANNKTKRFFLNMGTMDGFNQNSLKEFLTETAALPPRMVFNIDVKSSFSFFETESKYVDNFMNLNKADIEFNSRKVSFEISERRYKEGGGGGGERKSSGGGDRKFGGERRSGGGDRKFGGDRKYGEKKSFGGDRKSFGEKKSYGDRDGGPKKSYGGGDKSFGEKKYGDKPVGDKKYGDKGRESRGGEKKSFGSSDGKSRRERYSRNK
jgi:ATP-dependent RNA helicase DeaD